LTKEGETLPGGGPRGEARGEGGGKVRRIFWRLETLKKMELGPRKFVLNAILAGWGRQGGGVGGETGGAIVGRSKRFSEGKRECEGEPT